MEVDTSESVGVRGRGMGEEYLLPSLTPEPTPSNTPQQGAIRPPQEPSQLASEHPKPAAHIRLGVLCAMIRVVLHAPVGR